MSDESKFDIVDAKFQAKMLAASRQAIEDKQPSFVGARLRGQELKTFVDLAETLIAMLNEQDVDVKIAAAQALGITAIACKSFVGGGLASELAPALDALIAEAVHEHDGVRQASLIALGSIAPFASNRIVAALISPIDSAPLRDAKSTVFAEALRTLGCCDRACRALAAPMLIERLSDDDSSLRQAICDELASLDAEILRVIPGLVEAALSTTPSHDASLSVLSRVANADVYIFNAIKSLSDLERLVETLDSIGEGGCQLCRKLRESLVMLRTTSPPGRRRMLRKEVMAYIFGDRVSDAETEGDTHSAVDSAAEQRRKDRQNKTYDRMIETGRLRAIRIDHGLVDVNESDLEILRKLHHPRSDSVQ